MEVAGPRVYVMGASHFEQPAADLIGAVAHPLDHCGKRDAVGEQLVWIQLHLVLAHESADGRYFSHTGHRFELIAQKPVLKAAQIGETLPVAAVDDYILVDPSGAGCVGANNWGNRFRQAAGKLLPILGNPPPRPS